jgi:hypothetical protein
LILHRRLEPFPVSRLFGIDHVVENQVPLEGGILVAGEMHAATLLLLRHRETFLLIDQPAAKFLAAEFRHPEPSS